MAKMRCCVPFCKNTSDNVSTSDGDGKEISFHGFPSEVHLRAAWLRAFGKRDSHLPDSAVVCSQHFLNDDIYETEIGRQIVPGAIPSTVQVCMICLDTDSKLFLMNKYKLEEAYEKLTGRSLCDLGNLKQTVCVRCAQGLIKFSQFRDKSLRARALMMDLVEKHELITRQHIKMINRTKHQLQSNLVLTTLGPDHCDLNIIENSSEDKQIKLEEIELRVVVKTEGSDDSMSVDEDMKVLNEDDNNADDFVQDILKYEIAPSQCTLCMEEFVHERAYMRHMSMHLQDDDGAGECDKSPVRKPHTAVSCSSSHSSLITENKQADPINKAHAAQTPVAPLPGSLATDNKMNVIKTEEVDINDSCQYKKLTDCFVKLYDVFSKKDVPRRDGLLMKTRNVVSSCDSQNIASKDISYQPTKRNEVPATEYLEPVTNKVKVSRSLQSKTDRSANIFNMQCDNFSQNSTHTETVSFICDICRKMFKQKGALIRHIKTHSAIKPFTCKICQYKCKYPSYLTKHMRTHTGEKLYTCEICNGKFAEKGHLVRHMRIHTGEKPYTCEVCNSKFARKSDLVKHMRIHTGEKPIVCKICKYKCKKSSTLVRHMRIHTGEKLYTCEICNSEFARKGELVRHIRIHTGEKPYACNICANKFTLNSQLVTHMRTHTGEKPFTCEICTNRFSRKDHLVSHIRTHMGQKPFTCKICTNKFTRNDHLVAHMRTHTTSEKSFNCKMCSIKFTRKSNLVTHMRTHTGEKPFICKICHTKFARNTHLVTHMRTHTGERPFTCKICANKFARSDHLASHMRFIHRGVKEHVCKICEYKCSNKSSLECHMRTHADENPSTSGMKHSITDSVA